MDKKNLSKTASDYSPLGAENDLEQSRSKDQQQEDRLQEDLDDKRPAGDAGPEDAPAKPEKKEDPPY